MLPDTNSDFTLDLIFDTALDFRGTPLVDDAPLPVDPIGQFVEKCVDEYSLKKNARSVAHDPDWNEEIGTLEKRDVPREPMTLAKTLGIVRTEKVIGADGELWSHGFNSRNELVAARLIEDQS